MNHKAQHLIFEKENSFTDNLLPFSKFYRSKLKEYNENSSLIYHRMTLQLS